ncbi:MAG TPA: inorganic pyrophosphatase, partial [Rhodobacteraceae bacterium]|nr:inorganic pyrophosphatase [Paracoccaceae bacterium]
VLVVSRIPVVPGSIMRSRPIGVLVMRDEAGEDEKIIAVPVDKLSPYYKDVSSYRDLPRILTEQIAHFFAHYKDLEDNKWVEILRWGENEEALEFIRRGIKAHGEKGDP